MRTMFASQLIKTDVTAVKFISDYIFAGIGHYLHIFNHGGHLLDKVQIFDGHNIHGIVANGKNVFIHGGCHMQTIELSNLEVCKLKCKQCKDWVLTAEWIQDGSIAVIVMNNKLVIYNKNLETLQQVPCKEKCILYSACIIYDLNNLVILSGTVFGQILIWKVANGKASPVLAKLKGHNGVIFSISYNKTNGYISSSSDDRSSILWCVENGNLHQEPNIKLKHKLFEHQARIFKTLVMSDLVITGGEDGIINVWNLQGELLHSIKTNGPIWSLDCNENYVVCGGANAGILLSPCKPQHTIQSLKLPNNKVPKKLGIMSSSNYIVLSDDNSLFYYNKGSGEWLKVLQLDKKCILLEVSNCRHLFALADYKGRVFIYQELDDQIKILADAWLAEETICALHWLTCHTFLTCQDSGLLTLFYFSPMIVMRKFHLPVKTESTAACQLNNYLIIGDRRGSIHVYKVDQSQAPLYSLKKMHGHLGVSRVSSHKGEVISLGRDGTIKTYALNSDCFVLMSSDKVPFAWLARFEADVLLAFAGDKFVIWDYKNRQITSQLICGGGHRSWDFLQNFCYIKDGVVNVVTMPYNQTQIICGFHTNTINSARIITPLGENFLLFSGSEDTNLQISKVGTNTFYTLENLKWHLSSIRTVYIQPVSNDTFLLFSAGGRGQILYSKYFKNRIALMHSYYLESNPESEVRVMDLTMHKGQLFAAYSDGNTCVFHIQDDQLKLQTRLFLRQKCVMKVCAINQSLICANADGTLAFWDLSLLPQKQPIHVVKVHQSGIMACCCAVRQDNSFLLLTGGDDSTVVLSLFKIDEQRVVRVMELRLALVHCAQVSGAWMNDKYFFTTGVDQKVCLFSWGVEKERICCILLGKYNSTVADVHGLDCWEKGKALHVFVYGRGVEYIRVNVP